MIENFVLSHVLRLLCHNMTMWQLDTPVPPLSHYKNSAYIQGLSQDLETGCLKLATLKFWGIMNLKGDYNILRFQP